MMKYTVSFTPNDVAIRVEEGTNLLDAALAAGVHIDAACGGQGACGKCRVKVKEGGLDSPQTQNLDGEAYGQGVRLACRSSVIGDCTIEIPAASPGPRGLVAQVLEMGRSDRRIADLRNVPLAEGWQLSPMAVKVPVRLKAPTAADNVSDLTRFSTALRQQHGLQDVVIEMRCIKAMPQLLRDSDWQVTATCMVDPLKIFEPSGTGEREPWRLVRLEGGDTSGRNLAVAVDVGTTTVCAQLVDLNTGNVLADKTVYNGQIAYGADVITRIVYAQKPGGAKKLQSVVVSSINYVIDELMEETASSKKDISAVAVAGNTTMTHLLLNMETRYIREAPYVPAASCMLLENAVNVGIDLPDCSQLYVFPSVASYVGGDIVSGILGSGVFQKEELTLYMDIGTNGEIVLGNRDWLACAACSMGPAFEGGGIKHGMRADQGAVEGFHINPVTLEPMLVTVGRTKPKGICGSGLISILAELLAAGVIDPKGKFARGFSSERVRQGRYGYEYVLAWAEHGDTGEDIVITEVDIENLIRAKGALFAGCVTLLESLSLTFDDLERVIIAGAFGRYINLEKGQRIGLFPDIPVEKFHFLGNGSLIGARTVCLCRDMLREVERIGKMMTNVELSDNASFMDKYMAALFLPHTETRFFPNVGRYLQENARVVAEARKAR
jgi:uncharacterized 2Fe-2S/4Fe-4S cluster protein (DUF4445 family)